MTFSFCTTQRPQYNRRGAERLAASKRLSGFKDAEAFPCPYNPGDHWHVADKADDPLLEHARRAQAERAERLRKFDKDRAMRSQAMVEGFRHSGM